MFPFTFSFYAYLIINMTIEILKYSFEAEDWPIIFFIFLCTFTLGTINGIVRYFLYGNPGFDDFGEVYGKFGVGVKRIFSEARQQHVLVYYPVEKKNWIK